MLSNIISNIISDVLAVEIMVVDISGGDEQSNNLGSYYQAIVDECRQVGIRGGWSR